MPRPIRAASLVNRSDSMFAAETKRHDITCDNLSHSCVLSAYGNQVVSVHTRSSERDLNPRILVGYAAVSREII